MLEAIKRASKEELELFKQEVQLDPVQLECFEAATKHHHSVFITGAPDTGKAFTTQCIHHRLKFQKKRVVLTTTTTSRQDDAVTIYSFAGIGLGEESVEILCQKVPRERWNDTDVWIVDGIDSLSVVLFEKLNQIAQEVRRSDAFFGGIQMIFVGDFYQSRPDCYCFEAWKDHVHGFYLPNVYTEFGTIIQEVREGVPSEKTKGLMKKKTVQGAIIPTIIMASESKSSQYNDEKALVEGRRTYRATFETKSRNPNGAYNYYMKGSLVERELCLAVGAQVMCIENTDYASCGQRGVVTGFQEAPHVGQKRTRAQVLPIEQVPFEQVPFEQVPLVSFGSDPVPVEPYTWKKESIKVTQLPLCLAFSISLKKSLGLKISSIEIDLKHLKPNQVYAAMHRAESLNNIVFGPNDVLDDLMPDAKVISYYADLQ